MKFSILVLSILILPSLGVSPALAQTIQKWVDEDGVTHYSDKKPAAGEVEVKEVEIPEANVTIIDSKEITERVKKQAQQLEQERKAREQAAQEKEEARAVEEAMEREPMVAEEKKKKNKSKNYDGPYPMPISERRKRLR